MITRSTPYESVDAPARPVEGTLAPTLHARISRAGTYAVSALLILCIAAFGGVSPWTILLLETASAGLLVACVALALVQGIPAIRGNALYVPMAALAAIVVWQLTFGLTAYRHDTVEQALLFIAYAVLIFVTHQWLASTENIHTFAVVLTCAGFAISIFAVIQDLTTNGQIYWLRRPAEGGWIYGPYVNHNHYAGLMELVTPLALPLALKSGHDVGRRLFYLCALVWMPTTLFLSESRGGMIAMSVQAVLTVLFLVAWNGRIRKRTVVVPVAIGLILIAALLTWLGGVRLARRISSSSPVYGEVLRTSVAKDSVRMIADRPLLGFGFGTFPEVYPAYQSFYTSFYVNEAHNDFVQVVVETGLIGLAAMLWFIGIVYRSALSALVPYPSHRDMLRGAALISCTGLLVHSFIDFNLHIPANAALFFVLCAICTLPRKSPQQLPG
jgi:hypothetical protein